jgi:hypothetical protein
VLKYDAACRAIAEAKTVDEVTDWIDKAAAVREYGRRIKNRQIEIDAIEIRVRAKQRRGEILTRMKADGQLAVGRNKKIMSQPNDMMTLEDLGLTRDESSEEQKIAAIPKDSFERLVARCRAYAEEHPEKHSFEVLEQDRAINRREHRRTLAQALSDTSHELTGDRTFPCVYLDPAYSRKAGVGDRAYENHYRTEKWADIIGIMGKVAPRLQPNAWAFIWIPRAHMLALHPVKYQIAIDDGSIHEITIKQPLIWAIARALGMSDYSTCFVWTKTDEDHPDEHGTFLLARDQDEILVLYKKGDGLPRPKSENIFGSNHRERSRPLGHSKKPPFYRQMIARMTEGLPVLELFARHDESDPLPPNWEVWGNESNSPAMASEGPVSGLPPTAEMGSRAVTVGETTGDEPLGLTGSQHAEADPVRKAGLHRGSLPLSDDDLLLVKRPSIGGAR